MPIFITKGDITQMQVDAIVNAANKSLLGGGGVDGAIHRAAGKALLLECIKLRGCETGEAKLTNGYNLPAKYVIHTVGPVWQGGGANEKQLLTSCYRKSLEIALEYGCQSIAFPLISSGVYGYPKDESFAVAYDTIKEHLGEDMTAYIVIFDDYKTAGDYSELDMYIAEKYRVTIKSNDMPCLRKKYISPRPLQQSEAMLSNQLRDIELDESFAQMLLRKIDEKGITDAQCYIRANVDRKLFSKIRSDINYHPSKSTAFAFAIALELDLKDTSELLKKAGYAISHSNKFDIIIEYFIQREFYDIYEINKVLFSYDQKLLGC